MLVLLQYVGRFYKVPRHLQGAENVFLKERMYEAGCLQIRYPEMFACISYTNNVFRRSIFQLMTGCLERFKIQ
jgi:hypothetical protein